MNEYTPPQATDIERAVIGAMLLENFAIDKALELLNAESFYSPINAILFTAISEVYNSQTAVDQLTVAEHLKAAGKLETIGGEITLAGLLDETASAGNIENHCRILIEKASKRKLIAYLKSTLNSCFHDNIETPELLELLHTGLGTISDDKRQKFYSTAKEAIPEAHEELVRRSADKVNLSGVPTGFKRIDDMTGGWKPGNLILLAAKTSKGKTALALDFLRNAASKGTPAVIFSLEMTVRELCFRMIQSGARVEIPTHDYCNIKDEEWKYIGDTCCLLTEYPILFDDSPALTLPKISAKIRRLKQEHKIGLVIVDYIQLMQGLNTENRRREVGSLSRGLKLCAKQFEIPIIALSQLSRKADGNEDRRPILSDLKETSDLEQDADVVIFIHNPTAVQKQKWYGETFSNEELENIRELDISKNRQGKTGIVLVYWSGKYTGFSNLEYTNINTGSYGEI